MRGGEEPSCAVENELTTSAAGSTRDGYKRASGTHNRVVIDMFI